MSTDALAGGWARVLGGDRKQFNMFIDKMLDGFAYHKIVVDKAGKPVDYVFLEVNHAFEKMTGLKRERIIGKKVTEVLSGIEKDPADWIGVYGKVALTGEPIQFENYNEALCKWFKVVAYCPEKGYFVALFEDITERKKAEEARVNSEKALKESESRFSAIVNTSIVPIAVTRISDGSFLFTNSAYDELLGYKSGELIGKTATDFYANPKDRVALIDMLNRNGLIKDYEFEVRRKNSTQFWVSVSSAPLLFSGQRALMAITINVTERKKAEEALRESEEHLRFHAENTPLAVVEWDKNFVVTRWAGDAEKIFGWKPSETIGKPIMDLHMIYEPDIQIVEKTMSRLTSGETKVVSSNRNVTKDGRVIYCTWYNSVLLDVNKKMISVFSFIEDYTAKVKAEEALKESEQLYHSVFDNSQDGFQLIELVYDKNGNPIDHKFLKVNHAYEKIIGVKAEDILDKTAKYISPNQELHWLEVPDRVAKTGISEHVELYNKDINKTLDCYYFLYSKNVVGTLFRDITERKLLEKQLQDQERLAAIGATAGMVGHDIRNPLQAITGDVYLAKTELANFPESEEKTNTIESLQEIEKNIDYINKIVQDLQDFARPLNPKAEEADLNLIITKLFEKNNWPDNIELNVKVESNAKKIATDPYYINRIMYNLITNAVQAMPNGGKLTVHAFRNPKDLIMIVKDTGVGIPKDVQAKMFTLMFTTKAKGQGFGLPVVKRMTESLGGTVTFESEEGKGTTFTVRLPLNS